VLVYSSCLNSTTVINELRKSHQVMFFYFDTRDQAKQSYLGMISSLLSQVASVFKSDFTLQQFNDLYATSNNGQIHSSKDIENPLINILRVIPFIFYVVLDAMDECQDKDKAFTLIDRLLKEVQNVHIFLTSRPHMYNVISSGKDTYQITLGSGVTGMRSDIEQHVDKKLKARQLPDELKDEIKDVLVNGADGQ